MGETAAAELVSAVQYCMQDMRDFYRVRPRYHGGIASGLTAIHLEAGQRALTCIARRQLVAVSMPIVSASEGAVQGLP